LAETRSRSSTRDAFDEANFHVAAWHEDLLDLSSREFITGVRRITELTHRLNVLRQAASLPEVSEWSEEAAAELPKFFGGVDGEMTPMPVPTNDWYDNEDRSWAMQAGDGLSVTDAGWTEVERILAEAIDVPDELVGRLEGLLDRDQFDTVVREMGAALETLMREHLTATAYGHSLIEEFIDTTRSSGQFIDAFLKVLRTELRTAFKFERNMYAHRLVEVPRAQGLAIASRFFLLYQTLASLTREADS
jgi:hypothetical protein